MDNAAEENGIRTEPKPDCILCGQHGDVLYVDLRDRLFGVPGEWALKKCPNAGCGLVWLDPAPLKEDLWKAYATYYTHQDTVIVAENIIKRGYRFVRDCYLSLAYGYFGGQVPSRYKLLGFLMYFFPGRRADVDFSVMYLPAKPRGRLLEIGCGNGQMLNFMGALGWEIEGIDFDPAAVENARHKGLRVALGSLEEQRYRDREFDAIIMSHVIEHVADPKCLLVECHRILKPGGVLSMVTPNMESMGSRIYKRSWLHLDPPRHLALFNCRALQALAHSAGFSSITARTTIRDAHALFWGSHSIKKRGDFVMGTQPGLCTKTLMLSLRLAEGALLKVFPRKGEEISLLGIKP
ncbi:methyltransferase domain-containing protein [Geobacter hydrogenophilus]|uniref:Class I SAM-dependent methyltransferase n=1 Tax=Geobacter hydrogenophilus TaxID=40983 RepID=A0A9W6G322_9BACT|nr:class I SAM-dependent methyltransferase [Geobacter hydrogenophilus]MBT0894446.1 methyltransferase domain-containing protein [Geobacter hydrogenophilus]GLI39398.1 hypothetical protein GHYDROH2_28990 [Geobacter hydrogenophilus]